MLAVRSGSKKAPGLHTGPRHSIWRIAALVAFALATMGSILVVDATVNSEPAAAIDLSRFPKVCPVYTGECIDYHGYKYSLDASWSTGFWLWKDCFQKRTWSFIKRDAVYYQGNLILATNFVRTSVKRTITVRVGCLDKNLRDGQCYRPHVVRGCEQYA